MRRDAADTADGTQPSEPSGTFADPLAGISSGEQQGWGRNRSSHDSSTAPRPTAPNPETVRALLNDVFAPASERTGSGANPDADPAVATVEEPARSDGEGAPVTPVERAGEETRPGMLPAQRRTWPSRRRLTRQAWRPRGRTRPRPRKPAVANQQPPSMKPTRGFAGVMVAILLLLVFCVVAIQVVVSFVGMFTGSGG